MNGEILCPNFYITQYDGDNNAILSRKKSSEIYIVKNYIQFNIHLSNNEITIQNLVHCFTICITMYTIV